MTQVGLLSVSVDGVRAEDARSVVLHDQDCQSRKLEAFERLAARVADDFNNLLLVIAGYSEVLLGLEELPADGRRSAQEIKRAAERLCRDAATVKLQPKRMPKLVALASLVEGMALVLRCLRAIDPQACVMMLTSHGIEEEEAKAFTLGGGRFFEKGILALRIGRGIAAYEGPNEQGSSPYSGGRIVEPITGAGAGARKQGGYDVAHTRHRR